MPTFSTAVLATPAAANGAAYATFHTGANRRAVIRKIIMTSTQTTTTQVGLILSSNTPVATTSTTPQPLDAADATATAALDTAWSTAPTIGSNFFEEFTLGPSIGAGLTDQWSRDASITLAKSVWLVFWNPGGSAGSACSLTILYDE
jgi:hypothetical protein